MSIANRIRFNSFFSLSSSVIRLLTSFIFFIGIARFYGIEVFGSFTAAHTLTLMFLYLADFGLDILLTIEVARSKENASKILEKYFPIKLILSVAALAGAWLLPLFEDMSNLTRILIFILSFNIIFTSLTTYFFALFKGIEQFQHETKISLIINLSLIALLILCGFLQVEIQYLALAFILSRAVGLALAFYNLNKTLHFNHFRLSFKGLRSQWKIITVFGLHLILGNLYFQLDTILLSIWKGDLEVGIYQAAFKLIMFTLIIPDVMINAMLPVLSNYYSENKEKWLMLAKLLNKTLFMISIPIALILFSYAEQIISLLYGKGRFIEAATVLRIFAVTIVIRYSAEAFALMLTTSHRQFSRVVIVAVAVTMNFSLNSYAIPKYGIVGAAVVSLITNLIVGISYFFTNHFRDVVKFFNIKFIVFFGGTIAFGFILNNVLALNWIIALGLITIFSCFFIYFIGYNSKERNLIFTWQKEII